MTIFSRIKTIVAANVNELLAQTDEPAETLERFLNQLEVSAAALHTERETIVTMVKRLELQCDKLARASRVWRERAQEAVEADDDAAAVDALSRARDADARVTALGKECSHAQRLAEQVDTDLHELNRRIRDARAQKENLLLQLRMAELKERSQHLFEQFHRRTEAVEESVDRLSVNVGAFGQFRDRIERRLVELESAVEWVGGATARHGASVDEAVEQELIALKSDAATTR